MAFDYVSKINNVVNVLKAHNTSTSSPDLSASMSVRIPDNSIKVDDINISGLRTDQTPAVYVSLNTSDEEETVLGGSSTRRKEKNVVYDIFGIWKSPMSTKHESKLIDFYQMASNVEEVLKSGHTLSNTALHTEPTTTDFKAEESDNTIYKVFKTTLNVRYFYQ